MRAPPPRCSQCSRAHSGQCRQGSNICYTCGDPSHYMGDCAMNNISGMVQPTRSIQYPPLLKREAIGHQLVEVESGMEHLALTVVRTAYMLWQVVRTQRLHRMMCQVL